MNDDRKTVTNGSENRGFWTGLLMSFVHVFVKFIIAFILGTGAGGIVCWYYNIPLVFAFLGGILVLGLALAISSESSIF